MKALSISVVKSTTKTNINHNNRTLTKNEMRANTHIDTKRSDSNIYLVQEDIKKIYDEEFSEALENYNDKQKRNDRKINNYYEHISNSKKTAVQQEMIFQIGTAEDFENENLREVAVGILKETFDTFKDQNPQLKIFNAVIHNDEATPHLHVNFVPVATGYKRGLEKQVAFDKAILQQDSELNKTRPFEDWREQQVSNIEKIMSEYSLERNLVGTNKISDVNHFKAIKETERQLKSLNQELQTKETEVKETIKTNDRLKEQNQAILDKRTQGKEKALKELKTLEKGVKPKIFNKEMVQIPKNDYEDLKKEYLRYSVVNKVLKEQNNKYRQDNSKLFNENKELIKKNSLMVNKLHDYQEDEHLSNQLFDLIKPTLIKYHDQIQKSLNIFPISNDLKNYFKGFVGSTLNDRNLKYSKEVALFSNHNSYEQALDEFSIGSTVLEHQELQDQKIEKQRSYGFSR